MRKGSRGPHQDCQCVTGRKELCLDQYPHPQPLGSISTSLQIGRELFKFHQEQHQLKACIFESFLLPVQGLNPGHTRQVPCCELHPSLLSLFLRCMFHNLFWKPQILLYAACPFFLLFAVPWVKHRASHMLGRHLNTHLWSWHTNLKLLKPDRMPQVDNLPYGTAFDLQNYLTSMV